MHSRKSAKCFESAVESNYSAFISCHECLISCSLIKKKFTKNMLKLYWQSTLSCTDYLTVGLFNQIIKICWYRCLHKRNISYKHRDMYHITSLHYRYSFASPVSGLLTHSARLQTVFSARQTMAPTFFIYIICVNSNVQDSCALLQCIVSRNDKFKDLLVHSFWYQHLFYSGYSNLNSPHHVRSLSFLQRRKLQSMCVYQWILDFKL